MSDRILGAVCVIVAAAMAWSAQNYTVAFSYEPVGPRAFPRLLAVLMAIAGAWLMIRPSRHAPPFGDVRTLGPVALSAAAVFLYAALFQTLGFTIATAVMAIPIGMAFGGSWLQSVAGGVGLGVGLYLLFDKLLDVVLPTGILAPLIGGH
jgi:putative tricarboxylic transport membrane protein